MSSPPPLPRAEEFRVIWRLLARLVLENSVELRMIWRLLARLVFVNSEGEVGTLRRELRLLRGAEEVGACGRIGCSRRIGRMFESRVKGGSSWSGCLHA